MTSALPSLSCDPPSLQPVSLAERSWVHADEVLMRRGRQWRPCYLVLLSDLLLVSQRNRQLVFVTEQPVLLSAVTQHTFNVKKKGNSATRSVRKYPAHVQCQ